MIAIWRISDVTALTDYWQSEYHFLDSRQSINNAFISFYGSFARRASADLVTVTTGQCLVTPIKVKEAHVIHQSDRFHGLLVKYEGAVKDGGRVTLETHALARRDYKVLDPTGPVGRLINIQVRLWSPDLLWVSFFLGSRGNESECGTNKSCEPQSSSWAICLFRAPIHSPWTQKKRYSFLIIIVLPTKSLSKFLRETL